MTITYCKIVLNQKEYYISPEDSHAGNRSQLKMSYWGRSISDQTYNVTDHLQVSYWWYWMMKPGVMQEVLIFLRPNHLIISRKQPIFLDNKIKLAWLASTRVTT